MKGLAEVLGEHRVSYHHRNVGPEPVTSANLRYTSCDGCDWLGGHNDEAGWEAHLADVVLAWVAAGLDGAREDAARAIEAADDAALLAGTPQDDGSVSIPVNFAAEVDAALAVVRDALGVPSGLRGSAAVEKSTNEGEN